MTVERNQGKPVRIVLNAADFQAFFQFKPDEDSGTFRTPKELLEFWLDDRLKIAPDWVINLGDPVLIIVGDETQIAFSYHETEL